MAPPRSGDQPPQMPLRRRKRRSTSTAVVPAAIAGVAALAAVVVARIRGGGLIRRGVRGPKGAPTAAHVTWTCACGTKYRSAGLGRHQVHWLADAPEDDPVLGDACVECGRPLPVTAE
jgi:hypothetical protein